MIVSANNRPVMIIYRDKHGRRRREDFANASRVTIYLRNGNLDDARCILAVYEDGLCLYSSLASDKILTVSDLQNFFNPELTH